MGHSKELLNGNPNHPMSPFHTSYPFRWVGCPVSVTCVQRSLHLQEQEPAYMGQRQSRPSRWWQHGVNMVMDSMHEGPMPPNLQQLGHHHSPHPSGCRNPALVHGIPTCHHPEAGPTTTYPTLSAHASGFERENGAPQRRYPNVVETT